MNVTETIEALKTCLATLQPIIEPAQTQTISVGDALAKLAGHCKDSWIHLDFELKNGAISAKWTLSNGANYFYGADLAALVEKAIVPEKIMDNVPAAEVAEALEIAGATL